MATMHQIGCAQLRWIPYNRPDNALTRVAALTLEGLAGQQVAASRLGDAFVTYQGSAALWRADLLRELGTSSEALANATELTYRCATGWDSRRS